MTPIWQLSDDEIALKIRLLTLDLKHFPPSWNPAQYHATVLRLELLQAEADLRAADLSNVVRFEQRKRS